MIGTNARFVTKPSLCSSRHSSVMSNLRGVALGEAIICEHYKAVREEEMERIRQREKYMFYFLTGTGGAFGVFLANNTFSWILLAIPALAFFVGLMYAHTDETLGSLSRWLRTNYSEMLVDYSASNPGTRYVHWDGSGQNKEYYNSAGFARRYWAVSGLLSLSSAVGTLLAVFFAPFDNHSELSVFWFMSGVIGIAGFAGSLAPLSALRTRRFQVNDLI